MNAPTLPDWLTTTATPTTLAFSIIPDVGAKSIQQQAMTWPELAAMIANPPTYPDKFACPLIKLATFGPTRTKKDSLRHDGNVLTVTGVEGDYDAEQVPMSVAVERARAAGIAAVFYTSARHTPEKPRWRVVCPLSAPTRPDLREGLLACVDALLGNILASESYALSQTYFYGRVAGAPFESVIVDGVPFDTVLPAAERARRQTKAKGPTKTLPLPDDFTEVLENIDPKGDYTTEWMPTVLGALNTFGEAAIPGLVEWSLPWYQAEHPQRTAEVVQAIAAHDIGKRLQSEGTATWESVRERAGLPRVDVTKLFAGTPPPAPAAARAKVQLVSANDVQEEAIDWLWQWWLARGKIHIMAGAPGTGKTTLALLIAAIVSSGGTLPDGTVAPAGKVLIWTGEDGLADTIKPRLIASGANLDNIHFITEIEQNGERVPFDPALHMADLTAAAEALGDISLLIIDSIADAVSGDSHKNAEVRRGLRPLVALGERLKCAVLGIAHFNKGSAGKDPLERVMGSAAFGAVARTVFACAKLVEDGVVRRVFCRAKSNIGPDDGGFEYRLEMGKTPSGTDASHALFGDPLEGTARQLLVNAEDEEKASAGSGNRPIDVAKAFLLKVLQDGPWPSNKLQDQAKREFDISLATLRRAKAALEIRAEPIDGKWWWALPGKHIELLFNGLRERDFNPSAATSGGEK